MKRISILFVTLLNTFNVFLATAQAQGNAFTYQGHLNDRGLLASGSYDLQFAVYDADTAGNLIAEPITNSAVVVSNGFFTVALDFGSGVFDGNPRWLEILVLTNGGSGDFTLLSPRQELTPTPYAIRSQTAGTATDVSLGAVVKSLNTLKDDITLEAGSNVTITPSGNMLTIAAAGIGGSGIWSVLNNDTYYNAGNVGIGTISPTAKLDVRGSLVLEAGGTPALYTGTGNAELNRYLALINSPTSPSASGLKAGGVLVADSYSYANPGKNDLIVKSRIGVGTPTPATRLTVKTTAGSFFDSYGIEHTDGTVRLTTYIDGVSGQFGTRSNHPLGFFVNDGLPVMTIDTGGAVTMTGGSPGTFTIGTPNAETGATFKRGANRADVRFNGTTLKLVAGPGNGPPPSTFGIAVDTAGNVGIGTESPLARLDVRGVTRTCVLTITGGCDVAEPFPMDARNAPKGAVMVIDDENPGRLKLSDQAYDTRVAGIVSGANGVNPGISLQQEGVLEGGQNVALSGRVFVQADAAFGAIKPGDLLTTSTTAGHAMKVSNRSSAQGAILGKAMSGLKAGKGMVLVLVTLQ